MSIPLIILLATLVAIMASLWKLFPKAGRKAWEGLIPGYNFYVWQMITGRPWYWILILLIPGVQFLMLIIMNVQLAWSYGQRGAANTWTAILFPFYLIPKMAFSDDVEYTGNINWRERKKSSAREWGDALLFAIIVAFIVRTFIFEAFTIPTSSMEKSMLVGDYLFVSKARYGAKLPETPISFPLSHHTLPLVDLPSFLNWQKLDYHRLPGWADVELADPVVFNYPLGDTVITQDEVTSWYQYLRQIGYQRAGSKEAFVADVDKYLDFARQNLLRNPNIDVVIRPKDKKENYVKRCVGMPGQTLEIKDGMLTLDGEPLRDVPGLQHDHTVFTTSGITKSIRDRLKEQYDLNYSNITGEGRKYSMLLTDEQRGLLAQDDLIDSMYVAWEPKGLQWGNVLPIFPNDPSYDWSVDNFGPLLIPARGLTIELDATNLPLYRRVIEVYEEMPMTVKGDDIFIDGEKATSYTFKLDYYWMMGDNRHRSQDSRYFGFVPEDHVVGRPSFVWLSLDKELDLTEGKIRFGRMFKGVD